MSSCKAYLLAPPPRLVSLFMVLLPPRPFLVRCRCHRHLRLLLLTPASAPAATPAAATAAATAPGTAATSATAATAAAAPAPAAAAAAAAAVAHGAEHQPRQREARAFPSGIQDRLPVRRCGCRSGRACGRGREARQDDARP